MEELAIEVCGKNGAYYKVIIPLCHFFNCTSSLYWYSFVFLGLCAKYSSGSSQHCSWTWVSWRASCARGDNLKRRAVQSWWITAGISNNILYPFSLNNPKRVPYEEVRLPPSTTQRKDLYVDDEVEVTLLTIAYRACKLCEPKHGLRNSLITFTRILNLTFSSLWPCFSYDIQITLIRKGICTLIWD